jgi:hypothetical protein
MSTSTSTLHTSTVAVSGVDVNPTSTTSAAVRRTIEESQREMVSGVVAAETAISLLFDHDPERAQSLQNANAPRGDAFPSLYRAVVRCKDFFRLVPNVSGRK